MDDHTPSHLTPQGSRGPSGRVANRWRALDQLRKPLLDEARDNAALTDPRLLPPENHDPKRPLPKPWQDVGARAINGLTGRAFDIGFPPADRWLYYGPTLDVLRSDEYSDEDKLALERVLFEQESLLLGLIEYGPADRPRDQESFHSRARSVIKNSIALGDVAFRIDNDFRLHVFRLDQWVCQRDSAKEVFYASTAEPKDPLSLPEEKLAAWLQAMKMTRAEVAEKPAGARSRFLFTDYEWNPLSARWVTKQEMDGVTLETSQAPFSALITVPYDLSAAGYDYGAGWVDAHRGELEKNDTLNERMLDLLAIATRHIMVLANGNPLRERDIKDAPNGAMLRGPRIRDDGTVEGVGYLYHPKAPGDYNMLTDAIERSEVTLGKSAGLDSEVQPQQERVTAEQIRRIATELDAQFGGEITTMLDRFQRPLSRYCYWLAQTQGRLRTLPSSGRDKVELRVTTGLRAQAARASVQKMLEFLQIGAVLDPAGEQINQQVALEKIARGLGINEPGLMRTQQEVDARRAEALRQAQLAAFAQSSGASAGEAAGAVTERVALEGSAA